MSVTNLEFEWRLVVILFEIISLWWNIFKIAQTKAEEKSYMHTHGDALVVRPLRIFSLSVFIYCMT